MERLTYRDANGEAWYSDAGTEADRLHFIADMEDILGDYDLDRLRELVEADREGRYIMMKDAEKAGIARLKELSEADREGRCAILSEPMKPMVYKSNDTDVYCPTCGETLSGGWPLADADDPRSMYQCPYCGQSIDTQVCEPYESALEAMKGRVNDESLSSL